MTDLTVEVRLHAAIDHDGKKIAAIKDWRPFVADMLAAQKVSANEPERE
ncbi:MAG: hypothetical protein ACOY4R_22380 [Pseudomonadota bacterium]